MIGIVCALKCEAEKIIEQYHLKPLGQKTAFPVYYSEEIYLIISGLGKVNAAAATIYLHMLSGEGPILAWLNIGLGGHPDLEMGEMRLAHQVYDGATRQVYYPTFPYKPKIKTETVVTVDIIERIYPEAVIYEMEASGFYQSALKFSPSELVHCIKVISDNKTAPPLKNPQLATQMIGRHMEAIISFISQMKGVIKNLSDQTSSHELLLFLEKWHFTVTEMHQLKRLMSRWKACCKEQPLWDEGLKNLKRAKEVLSYLNQKIELCFPSSM